jgi:hypothetical protein
MAISSSLDDPSLVGSSSSTAFAPPPDTSSSSTLTTTYIVLIAVGSTAAVVIICFLCCFCLFAHDRNKGAISTTQTPNCAPASAEHQSGASVVPPSQNGIDRSNLNSTAIELSTIHTA